MITSRYIEGVTLRYRLDSGGHSDVYKGAYQGREVAVKCIRWAGEVQDSISGEANVLSQVCHPNVVRLIGVTYVQDLKKKGLVVELLENHRSLCTVLENRDRQLNDDRKFVISQDICSGLLYLHANGVFHKSLHNRNILISSEYRATIIDFGHAEICHQVDTAERLAEVGRYHFGLLLYQIEGYERFLLKNTYQEIEQLEEMIGDFQISEETKKTSIANAREICWTRRLTIAAFREKITPLLQLQLCNQSTLSKPLEVDTAKRHLETYKSERRGFPSSINPITTIQATAALPTSTPVAKLAVKPAAKPAPTQNIWFVKAEERKCQQAAKDSSDN